MANDEGAGGQEPAPLRLRQPRKVLGRVPSIHDDQILSQSFEDPPVPTVQEAPAPLTNPSVPFPPLDAILRPKLPTFNKRDSLRVAHEIRPESLAVETSAAFRLDALLTGAPRPATIRLKKIHAERSVFVGAGC